MKISLNEYIFKDRLRFVVIELMLLVGFLIVVYSDNLLSPSLDYYYITPEEFQNIISTREETISHLVDDLYFNSFKLVKDQETGNWFYSIVKDDTNAYNPKIRFDRKVTVQVASLQKQINIEDITNNIPLQFIAYDSSSYFLFNVTCTTLPILNVDDNRMYLFDNRAGVSGREFTTYSLIYLRGVEIHSFQRKGIL